VVLAARSERELQSVAVEVRSSGGTCLVTPTDVSIEHQVNAMVSRTLEAFGRIDVLINNAGIGHWCPVEECDVARWDQLIGVNLKGVFLCSKAVIKPMRAQGGGHIVNISSGAGRKGLKNRAAYCATKFGVIGFSEALALEVAPYRIKVSVILPGDIDTDFTRDYPKGTHERNPDTMLTSNDVAEAILAVIATSPRAHVAELTIRPI
jgi:3-oxoacyl-[acyl-carrier protein] reductase